MSQIIPDFESGGLGDRSEIVASGLHGALGASAGVEPFRTLTLDGFGVRVKSMGRCVLPLLAQHETGGLHKMVHEVHAQPLSRQARGT